MPGGIQDSGDQLLRVEIERFQLSEFFRIGFMQTGERLQLLHKRLHPIAVKHFTPMLQPALLLGIIQRAGKLRAR